MMAGSQSTALLAAMALQPPRGLGEFRHTWLEDHHRILQPRDLGDRRTTPMLMAMLMCSSSLLATTKRQSIVWRVAMVLQRLQDLGNLHATWWEEPHKA